MFRTRGLADIVPLYVPPGSSGPLPPNNQGPIVPLAPALQAYLQGFIGGNTGAAAEDPTGLTSSAYPTPGAADTANVYGANGPYIDDTWSNLMQQGFFSGTAPAPIIGRKNAPLPTGGSWGRPEIIPDSMLPGPLKRESQLTNRVIFAKNKYDQSIQAEMKLWQWIAEHGGLKSCCRVPDLGAPIWNDPPWQVQPSQGEPIAEMFNLLTPAGPFTGANLLIGQFRVPIGYDGVIDKVVVSFTGDGHVEGSSDLIWRIQSGQRYLRNLGNILQTYGSFLNAMAVPRQGNRVVSGQEISVYANIPVGSPISGGYIQAGLFGWFYPRR